MQSNFLAKDGDFVDKSSWCERQMQSELYNLYANCDCNSSSIIYYDGIKRHSISSSDLHDYVNFIAQILENLRLSEKNIICLVKPSLAVPGIILGILKVASTFAFLDIHKPFENLQTFQKFLEVKNLLVEDDYLKDLKPKLCNCWKTVTRFYKFSNFTLLQSSLCKNMCCPNVKEYIKVVKQSKIAYSIQTSGTTGEAKVVQVPNECISSNIFDLRSRFSVTSNDVILQSTRLTFDPSIIEIFLGLSSGASLVFVADSIKSVPQKLIEVIVNENITIFQGTPSLISNFGEDILKNVLLCKESTLRILAFGGEICPSTQKLKRWKSVKNKTELYNLYGLTELSCWASCFKINLDNINFESSIPIGEPLLDTKFEIHDEYGNISDKGELYLGGGRKRFCIVNDEKIPDDLENFLRPTGDLVTTSINGFIYFEGRNDSIIKYMGHKVSLRLVINTVEKFSDVANHFLHYHSLSSKLYLFIIWTSKPDNEKETKEKLIKNLKNEISTLPAITIVPVPFIPLTKHGKADIRKLMNLVYDEAQEMRNHAENISDKDIANIIFSLWKGYISQSVIMDNDIFIEKGGNSITAVQFASEIEWQLQLHLPLLVEKILNATFKEINDYVRSCFKDGLKSLKVHENYFVEFSAQPQKKRKYCDISHCFKVCSKQGPKKYCKHTRDLDNCFNKISNSSESLELHLNLAFIWDLKKCIDASPCILYLPYLPELLVFIGSHYGIFSCIDVNKKSEKWQVLVQDRIESSACISACGSYVLFGSYDHHLYCINIRSGTLHWKFETEGEVKSSPSVSLSNYAFVGSHDKHVYAVNVENGYLLWKNQIAHGSIFSSPAIIEDMDAVCVGTLDGILALIKMASGNILWKYNAGKPFFSSPLVTSNLILIGNTNKFLLCLDFDGKKKFTYNTEGPIFSSAVTDKDCGNQIVFGCHDCFVYCITLDGNLIWKTLCNSAVYATPCIFQFNYNYYVCAASSQGTIYFFELNNGNILFSWKCPGEIFSSPVILNDILMIGCRDNNVYCFNLRNCTDVVK